ncbi:50S ribosomal protein L9 [Patescibacteria group bacterium]|nr:50S ribosomal protein L9 [Patescibacteria group bacterium]
MKVILLENIANIGKKGDVKEVSAGFAGNFLFPHKKAILASEQNVKKQQSVVKEKQQKITQQQSQYQKIFQTLNKQTLKFSGKTSSQNNLFQAIHEADIMMAVKKNFNLSLENKWFKDFTAIKSIGKHEIFLHLPDGKQLVLNIKIEAL